MNIEIANRLYQYRKSMGLSQEELAARIGVSRQAVSKWERAEASPDTDNLIELSKIYGVTLDELLQGKAEEEPAENAEAPENESENVSEPEVNTDSGHTYNGRRRGIHIDDNGESVHIGFDGIHVVDKGGTRVDIDGKGVFVNENGEQVVYTDENGHIHRPEEYTHHKKSAWQIIPYPILTVIAYLLFGYFNVCGGWSYGWIVFLTIPIYYTLVEAIQKRDANIFCYPVLAVIAFLVMGFVWNLWHPGWIVFLTIPVYYAVVKAFKHDKDS